jgi:hypothetical protein
MHRKYADRGLAAVSVSLDDPKNDKDRARVQGFLEQQHATFLNVLLDAEPEVWQERLKIAGPPCLYVFDRDNRYVLKQDEGEDFAVVEKKVLELLGK